MASGIDQARLSLLLAVLEKRAGLNLIGDDVFVNVAGGMTVDEPASDLGVLAAIASSVRNRVIPATTAMFGEVGLAGEIRGVTQATLRVREAAQMGFRRCIMPEANIDPDASPPRRPASAEATAVRRSVGGGSFSEGGSASESRAGEGGTGSPSDDESDCELVGVRTVGEALDALICLKGRKATWTLVFDCHRPSAVIWLAPLTLSRQAVAL